MLRSLSISNFALIKKTEIQFRDGLNVLSGETGAGKSILIDALGLVLGGRASVENIRHGTDGFRIEAVFEITKEHPIQAVLAEEGIETEEDGSLIISRRYTTAGKNTITVNGCHVTLKMLKLLATHLVDMHGQHENQSLLRPSVQLALLDRYDKTSAKKLAEYQVSYDAWRSASAELARLTDSEGEQEQRLDMLRWQIDEITGAELKTGEEDALDQEIKLMSNSEKITESLRECYRLFYGSSRQESGALAQLSEIQKELESVCRYEERFQEHVSVVCEAVCQLEECARDVTDYGQNLSYDANRMDQMQRRKDILYKLRKKYGPTIEDVLAYCKRAEAEVEEILHREERISEWQKKESIARREMANKADALTVLRKESGTELAEKIVYHLKQLGMMNVSVAFDVQQTGTYTPMGNDQVTILFSSNLGQSPQPIQKVASGGEISRFAIALKAIGSWQEDVETMVLDEIDSGIGGQTAQMVAERIAVIAARKQVLCITHLPQIACYADMHLYVEKQEEAEETISRVRCLEESERIEELARLTAGSVTELSLRHAEEMLLSATEKKTQLQ
ncbi:MAG: DNA repair protein RecN [Selenomonadales bacterium]|nr:DNA repair protein RecN [Selenomonadales bacterium]